MCAAVSKPVNVVMGLKTASLSVADLAALGVRRISLGSALSRAALGAFLRAAQGGPRARNLPLCGACSPIRRGERISWSGVRLRGEQNRGHDLHVSCTSTAELFSEFERSGQESQRGVTFSKKEFR